MDNINSPSINSININLTNINLTNINLILEIKNSCDKIQEKTLKKGESITSYIEKRKQIYILLEGEAVLLRYDEKGHKDIIDYFKVGSIFGEIFYTVNTNNELSVEATKNCKVLVILYDDIIRKCKSTCKIHEKLNSALLDILFKYAMQQNARIEVLSKRSIREKIHTYFDILSAESYSNTIDLPFSLTDLADFLSVNRSAMMRELKQLEDEGFIKKISKRTFKLLWGRGKNILLML